MPVFADPLADQRIAGTSPERRGVVVLLPSYVSEFFAHLLIVLQLNGRCSTSMSHSDNDTGIVIRDQFSLMNRFLLVFF